MVHIVSPFILLSFASVKEFYQYEKNHYAGHAGGRGSRDQDFRTS